MKDGFSVGLCLVTHKDDSSQPFFDEVSRDLGD